jgi:hypothetical protein
MNSKLEVLTPESARWDEFAVALEVALMEHGCTADTDRRNAKRVMTAMGGIDIPKSLAFFESRGGYCDCEILLNVDDW